MPDNPHNLPQLPLDRVTQALYARIYAAMQPVRRELAETREATQRWVAVFAEFRDSLPELNLPAYHELRGSLGVLSDLFARALGAPLGEETYLLALQVIEHDLPRVAAIAAKLNEEEAPKFFSAMAKDQPGMTLAYFETPEVKPKTRIKKADFDHAISSILKVRFDELEQRVREDTANWLRGQGVSGDAFEIVEGEGARFVFRRAGRVWKVIFDGSPEFHIPNTLGARYLDWLLHHPGEVITAFDLELKITPEKESARSKDSFQRHLDPEAIRSYLQEIEKLRALREKANEKGDMAEVERLDGDIETFETEISKKGRVKDAGERSRGNVGKAIAAVKGGLAKGDRHEKAFLEHVTRLVITGYTLIYNQPQGKIWQ